MDQETRIGSCALTVAPGASGSVLTSQCWFQDPDVLSTAPQPLKPLSAPQTGQHPFAVRPGCLGVESYNFMISKDTFNLASNGQAGTDMASHSLGRKLIESHPCHTLVDELLCSVYCPCIDGGTRLYHCHAAE